MRRLLLVGFKSVALAGAMLLVFTSAWAWTVKQEPKLLPADGAPFDHFGRSVAMDGQTGLVAASGDDPWGSVYVFTRDAGTWAEEAKLANPSDEGVHFGWSVAIDGDTAVIGADTDDDNGIHAGAAHVFVRNGANWTWQAKLLAEDGAENDIFGYSVDVFGDTVLIGAPYDDPSGDQSGSAYVFTRTGAAWTQSAWLSAPDAEDHDQFGKSVALDGDTAVIGAWFDDDLGFNSGSAYVFVGSGDTWSLQAKLLPAVGDPGSAFGGKVALDGDTALIGADHDTYSNGAAYVFTRENGVWTEQAKLVGSDCNYCRFGTSVALDGDTAVFGADESAYIFRRESGDQWTQVAKLWPNDGDYWEGFGGKAAFQDDIALIGLRDGDDNGEDSGSVYVFRLLPGDAGDVPAIGPLGTVLTLLAVAGIGKYFVRRGTN